MKGKLFSVNRTYKKIEGMEVVENISIVDNSLRIEHHTQEAMLDNKKLFKCRRHYKE